MANERKDPADIDFTDAELDVVGDFTEAVQAGKNPDIEDFLKRCPGSEVKLRPILATALLLSRETARYRQKHPHVNLGRLLELKRGSRPKKK